MKKVLDQLMAHGGSLWLLESEIPRHFDRQALIRAANRGLVSITPGQTPAVRIEVTFKGRRHLENLDRPTLLRRLWLFLTGPFVHRLDD
ncbi:hypothetical protein KX729_05975 [Rhizobium sp. XQZ8]|uniref:hypothetical protein n=1 Tax=Rhizobium populisoli TaxID=2859785 RepID=UPI001CA4D0B2|nr:hypothetical protein [Rhizobium populisoli]MBW6420985.1 hypothetical protein [Rhizobium populisoli]